MRTALLALALCTAPAAVSQTVAIKTGGSGGQAGLDIPIGKQVSIRAIASLNLDSDTDDVGGLLNVAVPFRWLDGNNTASYVGPSFTVVGYEDFAFIGGIIGIEQGVTGRLSLFGEIGLDVGVDESYADITTSLNTGIGALYSF